MNLVSSPLLFGELRVSVSEQRQVQGAGIRVREQRAEAEGKGSDQVCDGGMITSISSL